MKKSNSAIAPGEIRAIRERLGLTQVEAGELLGGGPRAFTKYEAGSVKPAASVINLLRLLEAEPSMLATLQGRRSRPMTATMEPRPFEVTGEHVTALTERTFPLLLRRLLSAEAQARGLPTDGIHVASSIFHPDGGEDGRITWEGDPDRTPFLPSRFNQFQLKAGKISPKEAGQEVLSTRGTVKEMVRSALEAKGHYTMLCSHPYVRKGIEGRETRIREALRGAGLTIDDVQVGFRDAGQIAAWANHHPAVAVWLKEQTQPGAIGPFRSWVHWAGRAEHDGSPWVEDERLPVLRARLHEGLTEPRDVVRAVGLSGIGKSRLVLEALGPAAEAGSFLHDLVLYADESEVGSPALNDAVQSLADMGARAVVVVDRCPPESHRGLADMVTRVSSRLSLITIDNEMPPGTLDGTTFKVGEAPLPVVESVISRVAPGLPSEDQRRLVHFSKGFPGIAIRVARTWTESKPVAHATEDHFVAAFVRGRRPEEPEMLDKSAKLLAAFGLVDIKQAAESELREIAAHGRNLTPADLRVGIRRLVDRGVAQRRGRFVILQPRPIAMRLAERQWSEWSRCEWDQVLAGDTSANLKTLAARQLALLNTTSISMEVLAHVCRPGGPFDGFEGIARTAHAEVLSALAEIDSGIVVDQIGRSLADVEDLSEVSGDMRRHLVWTLEKIAFRPETFEDGARLLLRLAVAENEQGIDNNATGQFKALFCMVLGDTAADSTARLSVLDEAIDTNDLSQRAIVVEALIAGAETYGSSRLVGAETHGTRPALESWCPSTAEEATDYINGCVARLVEMAIQDDEAGIAARTGLGRHLRSLIGSGLIGTVETVVGRVGDMSGQWTEALESLGHFLEYDASKMDGEIGDRVRALIADLQPKELESRVQFLVTDMPWDFPCGEKLDFDTRDRRKTEAVDTLAAEIVEHPEVLEDMVPRLSRGRQRMAFAFGKAIASEGPAGAPSDWLGRFIQAVVEIPEEERNFDLLSGYIAGIAEIHPELVNDFKQRAVRSPEIASALPLICWRLGITPSDIGLIIGAFQEDLVPAWRLMQWTSGGVLAKVPAQAVAPLFDTMLDHSAEAFAVGVELMGMYAHGAPGALEGLRPQVRKAAENVARWGRSSGGAMYAHHFVQILTWILKMGRQDPDARATALCLARAIANFTDWRDVQAIKPIVPRLLSGFPEIVLPLVGQAIVSEPARAWLLEDVLGDRFSSNLEQNPPILSLPEDVLFAWCHAYPDRVPAFAAAIVPVLTTHRVDTLDRSLHPVTVRLLDEFGDREDVLEAIGRNVHTFGWTGSITTYFALYEEPLSTLCDHPRHQVRRWASAMHRHLRARIESARIEDEERDAQWEI